MKPKPQHATAHIVTALDAQHEVGEWHEPHGTQHNVVHADEAAPGILYHARLGASGLQLLRGNIAVCIPLELLFALAADINPKFNEGPDKVLTLAEVDSLAKDFLPSAPAEGHA